jgi:hypothetical protein
VQCTPRQKAARHAALGERIQTHAASARRRDARGQLPVRHGEESGQKLHRAVHLRGGPGRSFFFLNLNSRFTISKKMVSGGQRGAGSCQGAGARRASSRAGEGQCLGKGVVQRARRQANHVWFAHVCHRTAAGPSHGSHPATPRNQARRRRSRRSSHRRGLGGAVPHTTPAHCKASNTCRMGRSSTTDTCVRPAPRPAVGAPPWCTALRAHQHGEEPARPGARARSG